MNDPQSWMAHHYPPERFSFGLERIESAIKLLSLRFPPQNIVSVGGTNGKGTVSRLLYKNLVLGGKSAALFTSPHLINIRERFEFNLEMPSDDQLIDNFERLHSQLLRHQLKLSFFEFVFLSFLHQATEKGIDYLILEVGLGGRLDASKAVPKSLCLVTDISRDHQEILGSSYKKILHEKLGAASKGSRLIYSSSLEYLFDLAQKYCSDHEIDCELQKGRRSIDERNQFLLSKALEFLEIDFQYYERAPISIFNEKTSYSCCHNLGAVRNLVNGLLEDKTALDSLSDKILLLSYSHRSPKDLLYMHQVFKRLSGYLKGIYLTQLGQFKAASVQELKELGRNTETVFLEKSQVNEIRQHEKIYLSGSNYFVGHYLKQFCLGAK